MYHFPLLTVTTSRKLKYTSIFASSAPVHKTTFSLRNGQMQLWDCLLLHNAKNWNCLFVRSNYSWEPFCEMNVDSEMSNVPCGFSFVLRYVRTGPYRLNLYPSRNVFLLCFIATFFFLCLMKSLLKPNSRISFPDRQTQNQWRLPQPSLAVFLVTGSDRKVTIFIGLIAKSNSKCNCNNRSNQRWSKRNCRRRLK